MANEDRVKNSLALMERAKGIYCFLIAKAQKGETTTYEEIAQNFNLPDKGNALSAAVSPLLYEILKYCRKRGQPAITVLVVRKSGADKGIPGQGFWDAYYKDVEVSKLEKIAITHLLSKQAFDYWNM